MGTPETSSAPHPYTRQLARFASETSFEALPAALVARIKLHVLDGIGVILRGMTLPWTQKVARFVMAEHAAPVAAIWGTGQRTSAARAALVNATAGHAFEMDDIHKESVVHPNSLAVPVALALAQTRPQIDGRALINAIIVGYEIGTRVGNAATTALFLNGFHPQGTSGVFTAAATAARVLALDPQATLHAFGIAGSMGAGLMAAQEGAMVKRLHSGRAAESGITAALLAADGFTGITNILEADYGGFLSGFGHDGYRLARLNDGLGEDWEAGKAGFKMYPNVTSIHTALDALRQIMDMHHLSAGEIAAIDVGCGHMTYVHTAWPYQPAGVTAAQMNLFFGLATMALRGHVEARDYDEACISDPEILHFISRIHAHEDAQLEAMGPAYRHACRMTVRTTAGTIYDAEILHRRGSPEADVSQTDIEEKFRANVQTLIGAGNTQALIDLVADLENVTALDSLIERLALPLKPD